jgi:hypothetical protein
MASKFAQAIFDKLFVPDGKRFVVALNRDKVAVHAGGVCANLEGSFAVQIHYGDALDLEIRPREQSHASDGQDGYVLFIMNREFDLMADIAEDADFVNFQFRSFFPHYPWDVVKTLSFKQQEWLYEQPQYVDLDTLQTENLLRDGASEMGRKEEAFQAPPARSGRPSVWRLISIRPTEWMQRTCVRDSSVGHRDGPAGRICSVRCGGGERSSSWNSCRSSYVNIVSSTCGSKYPRIVTQVLPFISKQADEKAALVVDGWYELLAGAAADA